MTRWHAKRLGWEEVPTRKGEGGVSVLRPTTAEAANPNSLSVTHGMGEQPLHTDGAHLGEPPDIIVLFAEEPNETPTLLWSFSNKLTNPEHPIMRRPLHLDGGLFLVRSGKSAFLAPARTDTHGFRYDPGCMAPCDERARETVRFFEERQKDVLRHEWTAAGQILVIDNRGALHARAAVSQTDGDRVLTRIAYRTNPRS
jgi:hypothetical protein